MKAGISKGQKKQEEVHGAPKCPAGLDGHNNKQIPHYSFYIEYEEDYKIIFCLIGSCVNPNSMNSVTLLFCFISVDEDKNILEIVHLQRK